MPKLPRVNGYRVISVLEKFGFQQIRTKGSHVILRSNTGQLVVVPVHGSQILHTGTLASILREANISVDDFCAVLAK